MSGWSIVVPMYRESVRIPGTVAQLAGSALARPGNEFLFVDDGSPDDTVEAVTRALAGTDLDARVLRLPRNLGKGAAVRTGVLAARRSVVVFVDADLSSPPRAVEEVCRAVEAGAQVAVASRGHATSNLVVRQPAFREEAGKTFNRLLRRLGLTALPDTQCGLKAFDGESARRLFGPLQVLRFAFDVEVLLRAQRLGMRIEVLPTEWAHVEASRVSPLRDGGRMAYDAVRLAISSRRGLPDAPIPLAPQPPSRGEAAAAARRLRSELAQVPGRAVGVDVGGGTDQLLRTSGFARVECSTADLPGATADVVCAVGALGRLGDDVGAVTEWARVLRQDGRLLLTVPARTPIGRRRGGTRRYGRADLEQAGAAAGLEVLSVEPLHDAGRLLARRFAPWLCMVARRT